MPDKSQVLRLTRGDLLRVPDADPGSLFALFYKEDAHLVLAALESERPRHFEQAQPPENVFPGGETRKVKPEDSQQLDRGRGCGFDGSRVYDDRSKSLVAGQEAPPLQLSDQKKLTLRAGPSCQVCRAETATAYSRA